MVYKLHYSFNALQSSMSRTQNTHCKGYYTVTVLFSQYSSLPQRYDCLRKNIWRRSVIWKVSLWFYTFMPNIHTKCLYFSSVWYVLCKNLLMPFSNFILTNIFFHFRKFHKFRKSLLSKSQVSQPEPGLFFTGSLMMYI